MPTVDQIRRTITGAMDEAKEGPITAALELNLERNYLRDFLDGKKRSLKVEVIFALASRYDLSINDLIITKEKPAKRRAAAR